MLNFFVPPNEGHGNLDVENSKKFADVMNLRFGHLKCLHHPDFQNQIASMVENRKPSVAPDRLCCDEFEERFLSWMAQSPFPKY